MPPEASASDPLADSEESLLLTHTATAPAAGEQAHEKKAIDRTSAVLIKAGSAVTRQQAGM
jgi:threonine synthase